jgi:putative heme transporter
MRDQQTVAAPRPRARTRTRKWVRAVVVLVAVVGLAVVGLRGRLPAPADVLDATAGIAYPWALFAAMLQVASIAAFALQQRRLFDGLGVRIGLRRTVAVVLAGTALANTMPAGAAVATAYTVREYGRAGSTHEVAVASAVVSGLASIGGLAALYAGGGLALAGVATSGPTWQPLLVVLVLALVTAVVVAAGRRFAVGSDAAPSPDDSRIVRYFRIAARSARDAWRAGAGLRTRDWAIVLAYATTKWLADLACLIAVVRALDLPVSVTALAGIYLSVQIVRQVPLTPGGIGVIETAFVTGLTAAGAAAAPAAAAVLIYRLLSCWLLIPAGGAAALALRRFQH